MNLSQLIECNMGNVFIEKSYTKCGEETIPRPFSKKSKFSISNVLYSLILLDTNLSATKI